MERESVIQGKIIRQYRNRGWYVIKLIQTNKNGCPDLILLKDGKAFFIEVKSERGKLSKLQEFRQWELLKYGFETKIIHESSTKSRQRI